MIRTLAFISAILLLSTVAFANLSPRDARSMLEEYLDDTTSDQRRAEIAETLGSASERLTLGAIRRALRDDAARPLAIQLVGQMRHSQAWTLLRTFLDEEELQEVTVTALFAAGTPDALNGLANQWRTAEPGSDLERMLTSGWRTAPLTAAALDVFVAGLGDEDKRDAAREVLTTQLGLRGTVEDDELVQRARQYRQRLAVLTETFRLQGEDIFGSLDYPSGTMTNGTNLLLEGGTVRYSEFDGLDRAAHTVRLRFFVFDAGTNTELGYLFGDVLWQVKIEDDVAVAERAGGEQTRIRLRSNQWNEIEWRISFTNQGRRVCAISINRNDIVETGTAEGDLREVRVTTTGALALGGWELLAPRRR